MYTIGDLVEYRLGAWGRGARYRPARVVAAHAHEVLLRTSAGKTISIKLSARERNGHVRPLHGPRAVAAEHAESGPRLPELAPPVYPDGRPALRLVRTEPAPPHPVPRPEPPWRSPEHLVLVRQQPCCGCGAAAPSDPHHFGERGVGQRCSDLLTVPLCRRCHDLVTDGRGTPGRHREELQEYFQGVALELLMRRVRQLELERCEVVAVPALWGLRGMG